MIKNFLNFQVSFERLSIYMCIFWLLGLVYAYFFSVIEFEIIHSNYFSFLILWSVVLIISILNLNFNNHLISLLNICFIIFYIPKIFFISIDHQLNFEYLDTYPNFFTFLNQLTLQYFILSSFILVIFLKVNFKDILNLQNSSKIKLNLNKYTYIFFFYFFIFNISKFFLTVFFNDNTFK